MLPPLLETSPMEELKQQLRGLLPGPDRPPRVSADDLAVFTRQIAAMLSSGIPLHDVLEFYADSDSGDLGRVIGDIAYKVQTGHTFSRAMRDYPRIFSPVYVGLAETGEQSGQILATFNRLADLLERGSRMRKKVIATLTYPAVLLFVSLLGIALFVFFVVPLIVPLFTSMNVALPLPTRILLSSRVFVPIALFLLLWLGISAWLGQPWLRSYFRKFPGAAMALHSIPLKLPLLGPITEKLATTRILYSLATMLDAGLTVTGSLRRCESVAGNAVIADRLARVIDEIEQGAPLHEAAAAHSLFPAGAIHMLSVGEEAASLTEMVRYVADFYDSEVELILADVAALIEPVIMIVMGGIVGFIVLSAILPTVQLLQQL